MSSTRNFPYNNCVPYTVSLGPGEYQLEVWGAKGGSYSSTLHGGNGGYAKGTVTFYSTTTVYVYVGAAGSNSSHVHSCNGGGVGTSSAGRSGGGSTDIRINSKSLYSRIIVAGGGGGCGDDPAGDVGGVGGGSTGGNGGDYSGAAAGATQDQSRSCIDSSNTNCPRGNFGFGGNATGSGSGGGGGGWYGGSGSYNGEGAGGGSGYVLTSSSYKPSGYLLNNANYYLRNTVLSDGAQLIPPPDKKGTVRGNTGNGYAIITPIIVYPPRTPIRTPARTPTPTPMRTLLPTMLSPPPVLDFSFSNSNGETISDINTQFSFSSGGIYSSIVRPGKYLFSANGSYCGKSVIIEQKFMSEGNMTVNISTDVTVSMDNNVFLRVPGFLSPTSQHLSEQSKIIFSEDLSNYNCSRTEYSSLIITYKQYNGYTCKLHRSNTLVKALTIFIILRY
jgi:hypothetical protein